MSLIGLKKVSATSAICKVQYVHWVTLISWQKQFVSLLRAVKLQFPNLKPPCLEISYWSLYQPCPQGALPVKQWCKSPWTVQYRSDQYACETLNTSSTAFILCSTNQIVRKFLRPISFILNKDPSISFLHKRSLTSHAPYWCLLHFS